MKALVFSLLVFQIAVCATVRAGNESTTVQYTHLKQIDTLDPIQFRNKADFILAETSSNGLLQIFEEAASEDDHAILGTVTRLLVSRVADKQLSPSVILRAIDESAVDDNYTRFGLLLMHSLRNTSSADELREALTWARLRIPEVGRYSQATRLAAINTSSEMVAALVDRFGTDFSNVSDYGQELLRLAENWGEDPAVRRASVKGIAEVRYDAAVPDLLSLCNDRRIYDAPELLRATCVTLGRLRASSAISTLEVVLRSTENKGALASAAIALADIGDPQAVRVLAENSGRLKKVGVDAGVAFRKLGRLILDILEGADDTYLNYATSASQYLVGEQRSLAKDALLNLLYSTDNAERVGGLLTCLLQLVSTTEATDIINAVPMNRTYEHQWRSLEAYAKSVTVQIQPSQFDAAQIVQLGGQEYGDAGYRELGFPVVASLGHVGLFAGISDEHQGRILEVQCSPLTDCTDGVLKNNLWSEMTDNPDFWGRRTLSNIELTFEDRRVIMETAWLLYAYDPGYPPFILISPWGPELWPDALDHFGNPGVSISPDEIKNIRCDGLVEYCYEYDNKEVWGRNATNYDISQTAYLDDHDNFYEGDLGGDPNTELAPVVQCGRAGGSSTFMTDDATIHVELPEYHVSHYQDGSLVHLFVKATDESGIHQIHCRPAGYQGFIAGDVLGQHPATDNYRQEFVFPMSQSGEVYFYAVDNGGNGGSEFAQSAWIDICDESDPPAQPVLVSPANNATVPQTTCLEWNDIPGATDYRVEYGLEDDFPLPWDDTTLSDPAVSYYCPPDLQAGRRYWWRVRVWTDCGFSEWSPYYWFTTTCGDIAPPVPYVWSQCIPVYVAFPPVPGALGYLYQADCFGSQWWDNDSWDDTLVGMCGLGPVMLRLRTFSDCDTSAIVSIEVFQYAQTNRPVLVSPESGGIDLNQPIALDWEDGILLNEGAITEYYELQIDSDSLFTSTETVHRTESDFAAGGLAYGQRYFWRVKACNTCYCGYWSQPFSFTTRCLSPGETPVNVQASSEYCDYIQLTWEWPFDDVEGFNVYRVGETDPRDTLSGSELEFTESISGTYSYYVRAFNQCGEGPQSAIAEGLGRTSPSSTQPEISPLVNEIEINWLADPVASSYELRIIPPTPLDDTIITASDLGYSFDLPTDSVGLTESGLYRVELTCLNDCGRSDSLADSVALYHIGGQVVDGTQNDTLRAVWVYIGSGGGSALRSTDVDSTLTNQDGHYRFVIAPGTYEVWRDNIDGDVYSITVNDEPVDGKNFDVVTGVREIESPDLPNSYSLAQNYPNPFNPETRIEFDLTHGSFVKIDVYNIVGKCVRNLVYERLSAGRKAVTWDGRNDNGQLVSSGIYFYRIITDDFTDSRKMVLLK